MKYSYYMILPRDLTRSSPDEIKSRVMEKAVLSIMETFQENRLKTEFVSSKKSYSFIVYRFRKLNSQGVTRGRTDRISAELGEKLGYRPQISYDVVEELFSVYIRRTDNCVLEYDDRLKKKRYGGFTFPVPLGKNENNKDVVLDLAELNSILINGSSASGRKNLLSLIIRQYREKMDIFLVDTADTGIFDEYEYDAGVVIIKDTSVLIMILERIFRLRLIPFMKNEAPGSVLFVFGSLSLQNEHDKDDEKALECIKIFLEIGEKMGVYMVLSDERIPPLFLERKYLSLIKCFISFKDDDAVTSRALLRDGSALTLFYPEDALIRIPSWMDTTRFQCYRLQEEKT